MNHYKIKLRDVSRQLYIDHGWAMPRGLEDRFLRDPLGFAREECRAERCCNQARARATVSVRSPLVPRRAGKKSCSLCGSSATLRVMHFFQYLGILASAAVISLQSSTAYANPKFLNACGNPDQAFAVVVGQFGYSVPARFERRFEHEDGTTEQLRVFIAGEGIGGGWALIRAEGPLTADGGNTKICVRATGDRLALADFNRHRKLHKNFTTADFGDGPIKVTDAMMAIALQRTIAETADELTARGKPPDPELLEHQVHDFVFDYREEDVACKAAADRWNRNVDSCATYVEKLFELGSVGFYPLIHGRGLSKDDDPDPYLFTLLVSPERGGVRILHSNAKGGTVIVGSGVNFEGSEWAAFPE